MLHVFRRASPVTAAAAVALTLMAPALAHAEGEVEQPPQLVTSPTVTGTVMAGRVVSCDGAVFSGTNLGAPTYSWTKTGVGEVGTQQTYTPTSAEIGWDISCRASVANSAGSAEGHSGQHQVQDGRPDNTVPPKLIGKGVPGLAVTCTPGTWSGEGNSFSYQWLLDDVPISSATAPRLLLLDRFQDKTVACRVTASNASGSDSFTSNTVVPFAPPILAPLAKVQPALPRIKAAIARGITNKLVCNASCATESHSAILQSDAKRLGIRGRNVGGFTFIGVGHAKRTFKGQLLVTTVFNASAKRGLRKLRKPIRVDLIFETAWGPVYSFKKYHVADSKSVMLRP